MDGRLLACRRLRHDLLDVDDLRPAVDGKDVHAGFVGGFEGENEGFALFWHASFERLEFLLHAFNHLVLG